MRYALDAIEAVNESVRSKRRNHVAHVQVVDPADIRRFADLGAIVNAQMLWACRDPQMTDVTIPVLGSQRSEYQYPFAALHNSGSDIAAGSDWPVSTPDPWQALHVAVNRTEPGGNSTPLVPDQALSLETSLTAYTAGSHQVTGIGTGRLEIGAPADLAIADRNPFDGSAEEIHQTRNRCTVLGGAVVFGE